MTWSLLGVLGGLDKISSQASSAPIPLLLQLPAFAGQKRLNVELAAQANLSQTSGGLPKFKRAEAPYGLALGNSLLRVWGFRSSPYTV